MSATAPQTAPSSLTSVIDRAALVMDIAHDLLTRKAELGEMHRLRDVEGIRAVLSPMYADMGLSIDETHVAGAIDALSSDNLVFNPRVSAFSAYVARLILTRSAWWGTFRKRAAIVAAAVVVVSVAAHLLGGSRYRDWAAQASETATQASALRQSAALLKQQAAGIGDNPQGAHAHALAALAAVDQAVHGYSRLHVWSEDPAAMRAAFESAGSDSKAELSQDTAVLTNMKTALHVAQSELALAQEVTQYAQTWRDASPPVDLPTSLLAAWSQSAAALRAALVTGDITAVERADKRLTSLANSGQRVVEADNLVAALPAAVQGAGRLIAQPMGDRIADGDVAGASRILADLRVMQGQVPLAYSLHLVNQAGVRSGIERAVPGRDVTHQFYLLVQATSADGQPLLVPVVDAETGVASSVATFAIQVSPDVYEAVKVRKAKGEVPIAVGHKDAGAVAPVYDFPVLAGTLTRW